MEFLLKIATGLALAIAWTSAVAAERATGILIYTDSGLASDQYAIATEYVSAEKFDTVVNLVTVDGTKLAIVSGLVHGRIDYQEVRPEAFSDVLKEADLVPVDTALKRLNAMIARFPKSRRFLDPFVNGLKLEMERFRQGQGKWNGRWYATRQAAIDEKERPQRMAAAEQQREVEAEKARAEQADMAAKKLAADREAAIAEERVTAQNFLTGTSDLFGKFLSDPSWKNRGDDLSKIITVTPRLKAQFAETGDQGKRLRAQLIRPEAQKICDKALALVDGAMAWTSAADSFANRDAAKATATLQDVLTRNSAVTSPEAGPFWDALLAFFKSCRLHEEAAASHLQKGQELVAMGKNIQAIKEYETAHSLFPDHSIAPIIEKLRKESLGL